jgi:predicted  nucleic acid-binding Zn-ribbon protein
VEEERDGFKSVIDKLTEDKNALLANSASDISKIWALNKQLVNSKETIQTLIAERNALQVLNTDNQLKDAQIEMLTEQLGSKESGFHILEGEKEAAEKREGSLIDVITSLRGKKARLEEKLADSSSSSEGGVYNTRAAAPVPTTKGILFYLPLS